MATIRPFRGLRFNTSAEPLEHLVAPPYDVLTPAERDALASKSPHNIVHLTLPEQNSDDRSKFVKYARSAAKLEEWRRDAALELETSPAFYRYIQTFSLPGSDERFERMSLISAIKVVPYEKGVVLPHEQTFPKHKEDRLRILEATRAHLECIYGLFEDDDGAALRIIQNSPGECVAETTTEDDVTHRIERITDSAACTSISNVLADKKVWIADGHHRYETACNFRASQGTVDGEIPEDYMMMALSSMNDPGLVLLPTHRLIENLSFSETELQEKFAKYFTVESVDNSKLVESIIERGSDQIAAFGIALPSGCGLLLTQDRNQLRQSAGSTNESQRLSDLDVTILHRLIFEKILGVQGLEKIGYTRDHREALDAVQNGSTAAFLMNPPSVNDMREIALKGEKMPQKSTFYYPKILSGLVLLSLNDLTP